MLLISKTHRNNISVKINLSSKWLWMVAVSSATHLDCVQQNGHNCGSAEISTSRGYFLFINAYRLEHCTRTNFISCYLELMCTPFPYIFSDMYSNGIVGETQYIEITCIIQQKIYSQCFEKCNLSLAASGGHPESWVWGWGITKWPSLSSACTRPWIESQHKWLSAWILELSGVHQGQGHIVSVTLWLLWLGA